jgi:hypothetical protein
MAATESLPLVKQFLACESISISDDDGAILVRRPMHTIQLPERIRFPYRITEIWFYVQLTNVVQLSQLSVRMIDGDTGAMVGTSRLLAIPPMTSISDVVEGFLILRDVPLGRTGLYEYVLYSNGQQLADAQGTLTVR